MKKIALLLVLLFPILASPLSAKTEDSGIQQEDVDNSIVIDRIGNNDIIVTIPSALFTFRDATIKLQFRNPQHTRLLVNNNRIEFIINGEVKVLDFVNGEATFKHRFDQSNNLSIYTEDFSFNRSVTVYPLWAIIAPLVVILAYIFIRVLKK